MAKAAAEVGETKSPAYPSSSEEESKNSTTTKKKWDEHKRRLAWGFKPQNKSTGGVVGKAGDDKKGSGKWYWNSATGEWFFLDSLLFQLNLTAPMTAWDLRAYVTQGLAKLQNITFRSFQILSEEGIDVASSPRQV